MKIVITGRKCSPRESFKERAEKKLAKVERFFGDEAEAKITATVEKSGQTVEITVINNGMIFRAQERAENMNDALDKCVDSLVRQIRKNKTKLEKRMRSAAFDELGRALVRPLYYVKTKVALKGSFDGYKFRSTLSAGS